MLSYPVKLEEDAGSLLVTSPDFPELTTFGSDYSEALARASDALEEAVAARIADREPVPHPSAGEVRAPLSTLTSIKTMLYQGMQEQGIGKAELARRLGWHMPQVDRVLDLRHKSRIDRVDAAFHAIGRQLVVGSQELTSGS